MQEAYSNHEPAAHLLMAEFAKIARIEMKSFLNRYKL